jgi:hypothetical protein
VNGKDNRSKKKTIGSGMGTTILQDSVNESQERIIHVTKADHGLPGNW